jgi:hypothetical protein
VPPVGGRRPTPSMTLFLMWSGMQSLDVLHLYCNGALLLFLTLFDTVLYGKTDVVTAATEFSAPCCPVPYLNCRALANALPLLTMK